MRDRDSNKEFSTAGHIQIWKPETQLKSPMKVAGAQLLESSWLLPRGYVNRKLGSGARAGSLTRVL